MTTPAPLLPDSVLAQIADPDVREVNIPAGKWTLNSNKRIEVARSNLTIKGNGAILQVDTSDNLASRPISASSPIYGAQGRPQGEFSFTAAVTPDLDRITLSEPCPNVAAGDTVKLRLGVSSHDPAEPEQQLFIKVKSVEGDLIVFERPINRRPTVYESYDAIKALASQDYKVGPREDVGGYWKRGLGLDHGMTTFANRKPLENIKVGDLTLEFDITKPAPYSSRCIQFANCIGVEVENVTVINPVSTAWRGFASEDCVVRNLRVYGSGRQDVWNQPSNLYPASVLSLWGGSNCRFYDVTIDGADMMLMTAEVGSVGTVIERAYVRTWKTLPTTDSRTQFGLHGIHPGAVVRDIRFDIPVAANALFASSVDPYLEIGNIAFDSGEFPSGIDLKKYKFTGTIRLGDKTFGPMRNYSEEFAIATASRFVPPMPAGLYRSASITILSDISGVKNIASGGEVFANNPREFIKLDTPSWGYHPPGPVKLPMSAPLAIYTQQPGVRLRMSAELMPLK